jgi:hypothetical protein
MSWHTSAILIHADLSDRSDLFKTLGLAGEELRPDTVSFEEASSFNMDDLAVGQVDGRTCLWSNMVLF